jgi:acyl dehydratase
MIEWFDDLKLGMRFESGEMTVSKEDIFRFASEFDPQPFHLDEEAAKDTVRRRCRRTAMDEAGAAGRPASSRRGSG